ncbi:hypothetical protein ACFQ48_18720 [Hymenobacter caeli]|uniref:Lycopene cyclase domain-containing protein n=1 Tax=Hymenobacter caeli TaxID=2735894 RepID=A0ABX2FUW6_9BACT|nr:hypothetical protein [Hymenobacter caeli]NRT20983.1 hypothetical protein [Hymenobacter caeli]
MTILSPGMFVVPTIALAVAGIFCIYFVKRAPDRSAFKRFIGCALVLAFALNFSWELSHCPLYEGCGYDPRHVAFLALAALADAVMAALLYLSLALVYQDGLWVRQLTWRRAFWLVMIGSAGAVLTEIVHLAAGSWVYTDRMPLLPGLGVGFSPVLQFAVLPFLIYSLSFFLPHGGQKYTYCPRSQCRTVQRHYKPTLHTTSPVLHH